MIGRLFTVAATLAGSGRFASGKRERTHASSGEKRESSHVCGNSMIAAKRRKDLVHPLDQEVRRVIAQRLGLKAISDAAARNSGVSGSPDIHGAVADHQSTFLSGARFAQQRFHPDRVRLLLLEAVPTIYAKKMLPDAESIENRHADAYGLIRQDR